MSAQEDASVGQYRGGANRAPGVQRGAEREVERARGGKTRHALARRAAGRDERARNNHSAIGQRRQAQLRRPLLEIEAFVRDDEWNGGAEGKIQGAVGQ